MSRRGERFKAGLRVATSRAAARLVAIFRGQGQDDVDGRGAGARAEGLARAREAGALKGGVAKAAQLLGYLGAGPPPEARAALAALCDAVPALPAEAVRSVVIEDLGRPPEELFARWEPTPFAAASLGQVHAATGHDGAVLAVKVQYPGVAAALSDDLAARDLLRELAGVAVARALDAEALAELRRALLAELDYGAEAAAAARFRSAWAGARDLAIPEVTAALSSRRVLTMQRMAGQPLGTLTPGSPEAEAAARAIFRFSWGSPLAHGLLHADPNPGNFLVQPGVVACLDYGCTVVLEPAVVDCERRLWRALLTTDQFNRGGEAFRHALHEEGLVVSARSFDRSSYRDWEGHLAAPFRGGRFTWTAAWAARFVDFTRTLAAGGDLRLPAPALLLWRQRLGAAAVLGALSPTLDFAAALRELVPAGTTVL